MNGADALVAWRARGATPRARRRWPAAGLLVALVTGGAVALAVPGRSHPVARTAIAVPPTSAAFTFADGVLVTPTGRFSLGRPGDQVAVGDWSCDPEPTPALLRPSTGQVYRFDGWARPGADATAAVVGRVAGGQRIRAADVDGDGCDDVVVDGPTGAVVVR